ncbi:MAG: hypothetical protein CVV64_01030 [Candidatus Wallbacteria bacterium HGW-Wallbacteria-1]|jgi:tetratricopeptide (TPR) repeat protein|uniref:Outer membrane lipoprotein BamD-like domain-containing protein n=1 Tax=Candidatus Wallbacteria bacterium HGW-Wallbacteria-1 TaxID=2013854 RepID=A0A2N1PUK7_9BACT|nr:MAG: hypothetical protein CVV64_01030 [Candidatus Wallbacteria bacterium HGW-Wallbacteria-1]
MVFLKVFLLDFLLLAFMAVRLTHSLGARYILMVREATVLLLVGIVMQSLFFAGYASVCSVLGMKFTRRTSSWMLPLLNLAGAYLTLGVFIGVAKLLEPHDTWSHLTSLPSPMAIKVGAIIYICLNVNVVLGLPVSFYQYWSRREEQAERSGLHSRTLMAARLAPVALILLLAVLLGVLVRWFPQNIHFYYAISRARSLGNADEAREVFENFLRRYPESSLADNARMGLANLLIHRCGRPEDGLTLLLKVAENSESTYGDEAMFRAAAVTLSEMGDIESALAQFEVFLKRYPLNPLADDACVIAARELKSRGMDDQAEAWSVRANKCGDGRIFLRSEDGSLNGIAPTAQVTSAIIDRGDEESESGKDIRKQIDIPLKQ